MHRNYQKRAKENRATHLQPHTDPCIASNNNKTYTHTSTPETGLKLLPRSNTETYTQLDGQRNNTADIPSHDTVPIQSNHRKYSQDKSSQHNNKTLALWVMMLA